MNLDDALRVLAKEGIGDFIYEIRERVASDTTYHGNTWNHPRVRAWGEAVQAILARVREIGE